MKKMVFEMTAEERERAVQVIGNTVLLLEEGCSVEQIANKLDLTRTQVLENIYEILYQIRRRVGKLNFFKSLFIK